jgi:hypothetical protein
MRPVGERRIGDLIHVIEDQATRAFEAVPLLLEDE